MDIKENSELKKIAKHVCVLNKELGIVKSDVIKLKNDVGWIKRLLFAIAGMILVGVGKILFFSQ